MPFTSFADRTMARPIAVGIPRREVRGMGEHAEEECRDCQNYAHVPIVFLLSYPKFIYKDLPTCRASLQS